MIKSILILVLFLVSPTVIAAEKVKFTDKELSAVFTLMRPELNSIELHGRKLIYDPAPSIKFLGAEKTEAYIDLSSIGDIADIAFNHVKSKMPELTFDENVFKLKVPVEDQVRAVHSNFGSINFKNVVITAELTWDSNKSGEQNLMVKETSFQGDLTGSGVFRSRYLLNKTRDLLVNLMTKSLKRFLDSEKVQTAVSAGLLNYSKFYTGAEAKEIAPSSIQFIKSGIMYEVN